MNERHFIDHTPGAAYPELREVLPRTPVYRNGMLVNARPEPVTAPAQPEPSYRQQLAARIARSPFHPGAIEVLLREFSPGWLSGTPVERIIRSGRPDEDIELFVNRLQDPFLYLPHHLYGALVAMKQIKVPK